MFNDIVLTAEIFVFVMACLNIIKNAYGITKVLVNKEGKLENTMLDNWFFVLSFSYIITILIVGF